MRCHDGVRASGGSSLADDFNINNRKTAARKHMKASIFCLPSVGSRAEIEAGMAATIPKRDWLTPRHT
jgi:hypothetical protein